MTRTVNAGYTYSVVIPLYNKERHIERAIRSALGQSLPPLEVIVVDDGSTDRGAELAERLAEGDGRIRLIRQENGGASRARNAGIVAAGGTHVAFLDADDEWKPGFLKEIQGLIERYPALGAYGTAYWIVAKTGTMKPSRKLLPVPVKGMVIKNLFKDEFFGAQLWTSAVVVPRTVFDEVGSFLEGAGRGEDVDLWWRIGARFDIALCGARLAVYHQEADNRSDEWRNKPGTRPARRWWALDRLEALSRDPSVSWNRRKWMKQNLRWYGILGAYQRFRRGESGHGLWTALKESFGQFSFLYACVQLIPRFLLGR